ncbi:GLUG motif-containing protein, partial [Pseudoflavonifractor phocaeensis]|uniref:GLUG motif-containing protein n=1 Tax=Pseudoflavonifractor phocaeensis TaxID=1870988 RepID=UPI0023EEB059
MKHKKWMITMVVCLIIASFLSMGASAAENTTEFAGGEGTKESPYLISNTTHLSNVRLYPNKCFKMIEDISFLSDDFAKGGAFYNSGAGWAPIRLFKGTFDGDGHTISKLEQTFTQSTTTDSYVGLFGDVIGGTIKNVTLERVQINVTGSLGKNYAVYTGALAGYATEATIENCHVDGAISVDCYVRNYSSNPGLQLYTGGVVGYLNDSSSSVKSCMNDVKITVSSGRDTYSKTWAYTGGIVGYLNGGEVSGCGNHCEIATEVNNEKGTADWADRVGGIAGYAISNAAISLSYNIADLSGPEQVGGIVGRADTITVERCYNAAALQGKDTTGGIAGDADASTIENCYNCGDLKLHSTYNQGGIVGFAENRSIIRTCYNVGSVNGSAHEYGGILGYNYYDGADMSFCFYSREGCSVGVGSGTNTGTIKSAETAMQQESTFSGFDFADVWTMAGTEEYPYPELQDVALQSSDFRVTVSEKEVDVPSVGEVTVEARATAYYGGIAADVTESAVWSVSGDTTGVSIYEGLITITSEAQPGTFKVRVTYKEQKATHAITLIKNETCDHNWLDADCDTPKTCERCGATDGNPLGHDWKDADCDTPKTCERCGA